MAEEITIVIRQTVEQVNVEVAEFTIPGLISSDANNTLELGSDEKLFVSVNAGGESNLSLSKTKTTNVVANDNGTGFTLGLGNGTEAGISENNFTDAEKTKLSNVPTNTNTALSLKLDASAYNDRFKGKYTTLLALQTAFPTASAGDYAQVDAGSGFNVKNYNYDLEEGWVEGSSTPSASNTDELPEGSTNLYFTTTRVLATLLTGISFATGGAIVSTDSILVAFGRLQNQITNLLSNNLSPYLWALSVKTTPVDADTITINDTEASNVLKKLSLTNFWLNYIKPKTDLLYVKSEFIELQQDLATRITNTSDMNTWKGYDANTGNMFTNSLNTSYGTATDPSFTVNSTIAKIRMKNITSLHQFLFLSPYADLVEFQFQVWLYDFDDTEGTPANKYKNPRKIVDQSFTTITYTPVFNNFTISSHTLTTDSVFWFL